MRAKAADPAHEINLGDAPMRRIGPHDTRDLGRLMARRTTRRALPQRVLVLVGGDADQAVGQPHEARQHDERAAGKEPRPLQPVSYTQLEVYKRQSQGSASRARPATRSTVPGVASKAAGEIPRPAA